MAESGGRCVTTRCVIKPFRQGCGVKSHYLSRFVLPSCKWCTLCILLVIILVLLRCVFIKQIFTNRILLIILFGLLRGSQSESPGEVESCVGALTTASHKTLSESSFSHCGHQTPCQALQAAPGPCVWEGRLLQDDRKYHS